MDYIEIDTETKLHGILAVPHCIEHVAFQNMNFEEVAASAEACSYSDCLFIGCHLTPGMSGCMRSDCLVFPEMAMPFQVYPNQLYSPFSLYKGYRTGHPETYADSYDGKVYRHYMEKGKLATDIKETLARSLHDHSITDALYDFLAGYEEKQVVGIMGGHGLLRTDAIYRKIAYISKSLTERGKLMVSGGGPGAMEATHLGAWMACRSDADLEEALRILVQAPKFTDSLWLDTAFQVLERFPNPPYDSLGVPTWLYGHEPATPFATHIAKYFDNCIREDGILTIAKGGIIYTPGSAGTLQEIFQDAVQNHYLSFGYASPMVFLGKDYWTNEVPIYSLLTQLSAKGRYKNLMLTLADDCDTIVQSLMDYQ